MGTKAHACFSLLVSHGFVFMNGFALVALREIVLSSLPTASILSLRPSLRSRVSGTVLLRGFVSRYYSQNGRRPRIDISHSARRRSRREQIRDAAVGISRKTGRGETEVVRSVESIHAVKIINSIADE